MAIELITPRFHTADFINHYEDENKPLQDLYQNILILKAVLDGLGGGSILDQINLWNYPQRSAYIPVTSVSGNIYINLDDSNNFTHSLTEDTNLVTPEGIAPGQSGVIEFIQHSSSPKTLTFSNFWKFSQGEVPSLTASNSARDILSYTIDSTGTIAICVMINAV